MTIDQLAAAVERLRTLGLDPGAELVRNTAGNLAIFVNGDGPRRYVGHVDLGDGRVHMWEERDRTHYRREPERRDLSGPARR